jgi:hypothetical protein
MPVRRYQIRIARVSKDVGGPDITAAASCFETHRSAAVLAGLHVSGSRCDAPQHEAGRVHQPGKSYFRNRSVGGAISVTRSRMSGLLESGAKIISRGSSRAVQA